MCLAKHENDQHHSLKTSGLRFEPQTFWTSGQVRLRFIFIWTSFSETSLYGIKCNNCRDLFNFTTNQHYFILSLSYPLSKHSQSSQTLSNDSKLFPITKSLSKLSLSSQSLPITYQSFPNTPKHLILTFFKCTLANTSKWSPSNADHFDMFGF